MSASTSHIITIPIASAALEALTSVVFELLLLGLLAVLAQLLCAHYNLYRLYDRHKPIKIGSPVLPLRVHAPIGHLPLSIALAVLLLVASLMNNLLSFAINGRSEPRFTSRVHAALVTQSAPRAVPLRIDYAAEYEPRASPAGQSLAPLISARLRAIRMADQCMFCNFTVCTIYAYTLDKAPDASLVDPDVYLPSTCVTQPSFADDAVWLTYERFPDAELPATLERAALPATTVRQADACEITSVNVSFANGPAATARLATKACNVPPRDARCYRRPDKRSVVKCAAVSVVPSEGTLKPLKVLLFEPPNGRAVSADVQWVTNGHNIAEADFGTYSANVAYMAAIELSGELHLLQRMATARVAENVSLRRSDELRRDKLLSDVDLRLAVPSVAFNVLLLGALLVVDAWLYYAAVWRPRRQKFNTFASVPDVLAVLADDNADRRRVDLDSERPGVAIKVDQPSLGVSCSQREDALERHVTSQGIDADDWDELQIS